MSRPQGSNADDWHLFLSEHKDALPFVAVQIAEAIEALEKKVYVPGQWRCAKCEFRLTQSNLYVASGTVGPRDEPGDKCPNCNGPLWRVSAMDDRNEAFKCANDAFERLAVTQHEMAKLQAALEPFGIIGLDVLKKHPGWANHVFASTWAGYRITYTQFEAAAALCLRAAVAVRGPSSAPQQELPGEPNP